MDRQMGASEAPEVIPRCQTHTRIAQFQKGRFSPSGFTFPKGRFWCEIGTFNFYSPLAILGKKKFHTAVCFVMESAFCYRWQLPIFYHMSLFLNISFLCWDLGDDELLSICLISDSWQCASCNIEFPLRYSLYLFSSLSISANFHSFQKRNKDRIYKCIGKSKSFLLWVSPSLWIFLQLMNGVIWWEFERRWTDQVIWIEGKFQQGYRANFGGEQNGG